MQEMPICTHTALGALGCSLCYQTMYISGLQAMQNSPLQYQSPGVFRPQKASCKHFKLDCPECDNYIEGEFEVIEEGKLLK